MLLGMDKHFTDASIRDDVISGWMTNITLQLNSFGETAAAGLSGKAYIEGVMGHTPQSVDVKK